MCTFMLPRKWLTKSLRRCSQKSRLAAAAMLAGALLLPASARAQSPAECNANEFDITLQAIPIQTVAGATVNYFVIVENTGALAGCDVTDLAATFTCPGPTGAADGPVTVLATDTDVPFGTAPTALGPFPCVMPNPASGFAIAEVEGTFFLQTATPTPNSFSKTIAVVINSCLVEVDKQVSCDNGVTWVDQGFVAANEDGTLSCSGINALGPEILVRYAARNVGETPLFQCTVNDSNNAFDLNINGTAVTTPLAVGASTGFINAPGQPLCSDALDNAEPNTVTARCNCTAIPDPELVAVASDSANVDCQSVPELSVTKVCVDPGPTGLDAVTITATATTADIGFVNCVATDTLFPGDPTCPVSATEPSVNVPLTGATFNLAPGATATATGTVGPLAANACNTASVTCTIAGTTQTRTATADAVCLTAGEGCNTRTPGFWGTHPAITDQFLDVQVCGVTLDNALAGNITSAIEAMCSTGTDGKILGPQVTQLVRQCTAAALNIASSAEGGGNCSTTFPNLNATMAACCSTQSVCTGFPNEDFSVNSCIEALDAFNNSADTLAPFEPFVSPGPANPRICQAARGNGMVVIPNPNP